MSSKTVCEYERTDYSTLRRNASTGTYDKSVIHDLIDAAPYCHLSAQVDGRPYIQATVHWREGDRLYVHGATKNKMIYAIAKGAEAALAFTHFDGYVLARSAFNHAVAYRSATLFGKARVVVDPDEKCRMLRLFMERISPARWETVRQPTLQELQMTGVLEFPIAEVSAKSLMQGDQLLKLAPGGEYENEADAAYSPWTGIYPYQLMKGAPVSFEELKERPSLSLSTGQTEDASES